MQAMKKLILTLIRLYQKYLSFDHSWWGKKTEYRVCRFYPSCSEYTYQSIAKYGVIKGSVFGVWRILRCNPMSKGGHDPIK